jgi:hypothetical protein
VRQAKGQGVGLPHIDVQRRNLGDSQLQEILRSNDPVRLSWICALLADQRIEGIILDSHTAILEGSAGAIMRRLMVIDEDYDHAMTILREAGELPPPEGS